MKCDRGLALMGYYYFDFKDIAKQGIHGLLTSLLAQLGAKSDPCYRILSQLYSENNAGSQQPENYVLTDCLKEMLRLPQQPMTYIVVDALDECPNTSGFPTAREESSGLSGGSYWFEPYESTHLCYQSSRDRHPNHSRASHDSPRVPSRRNWTKARYP